MRSSKKVIVAMSGGVDSSVTAALLKEQGYECIGIHIRFWEDPKNSTDKGRVAKNKCCTLNGLEDARKVAGKLKMPFYVMNAENEFRAQVVGNFIESYRKGETPNPCVICNQNIKFGMLLERARELGADLIASGHYARVVKNKKGMHLFSAVDTAKDQSYFLYHLGQEKLKHVMFPIGSMKKSEVYELAKKFGLIHVVEKPQSQGLCFFSESSPKAFLRRYLPARNFTRGPIKTLDGRVIGEHKGLPLYTIGQRGGLGIGGIKGHPEGTPWYVVRMDANDNALIAGNENDILNKEIFCKNMRFVEGKPPAQTFNCAVRIRHRGELLPATVHAEKDSARILCDVPARGVAKGQAAVLYLGEEVIGGGTIVG